MCVTVNATNWVVENSNYLTQNSNAPTMDFDIQAHTTTPQEAYQGPITQALVPSKQISSHANLLEDILAGVATRKLVEQAVYERENNLPRTVYVTHDGPYVLAAKETIHDMEFKHREYTTLDIVMFGLANTNSINVPCELLEADVRKKEDEYLGIREEEKTVQEDKLYYAFDRTA